jgi:ribosomal protein L11 methyltransferase
MGSWALRTELDLEGLNEHLPALEEAGLLGIAEEEGRATAYFGARPDALPVDGRWEEIPDTDWHAAFRDSISPVTVGACTIAPPWLAEPGPGTIVIEMGQAFGTGHHETTTGCLAALQELDLAGRSVLDVGTGTGLLAIAAALLGAELVVGCDTDPLATEAAAENAARNGVDLELHTGSLEAVPPGSFDVVVANLDTTTISGLASDLVARLAPRGHLVASGVSIERRAEAIAAFEAAGLPVLDRAGAEWVVLTGVRGAV